MHENLRHLRSVEAGYILLQSPHLEAHNYTLIYLSHLISSLCHLDRVRSATKTDRDRTASSSNGPALLAAPLHLHTIELSIQSTVPSSTVLMMDHLSLQCRADTACLPSLAVCQIISTYASWGAHQGVLRMVDGL